MATVEDNFGGYGQSYKDITLFISFQNCKRRNKTVIILR